MIRRAVLMIIFRNDIRASIDDVRFQANVRVRLANSAHRTPGILILRVEAVTPSRRLRNGGILSQLRVFESIRLNDRLTILTMSRMLTVRPRDRIANNEARIRVRVLPLPILEGLRHATVEAHVIIRLTSMEEIQIGLDDPNVSSILVNDVAVSIRLGRAERERVLPL